MDKEYSFEFVAKSLDSIQRHPSSHVVGRKRHFSHPTFSESQYLAHMWGKNCSGSQVAQHASWAQHARGLVQPSITQVDTTPATSRPQKRSARRALLGSHREADCRPSHVRRPKVRSPSFVVNSCGAGTLCS
jgi:hypothetical protein